MASVFEEPQQRLNAVCPYFTMFPLSFPLGRLAQAGSDAVVLDPFCGRGTTLYAARLLGLRAVGVDVNPVATAIAKAKLADVSSDAVIRRARRLIERGDGVRPPRGRFWELAYHPETLRDLTALRTGLLSYRSDATSVLLRAIVMGILHGPIRKGRPTYLSNQMPRTYATKPDAAVRYWERHAMLPPRVDVIEAVERRARHVLAERFPALGGRLITGDVRSVLRPSSKDRFTHVITSPPYLGMRTYLGDQWLRAWFLGGPPATSYALKGSFGTVDIDRFAAALASTWRAVARCCAPGARLVVRLGSLPSIQHDPAELLERSIREADANWEFVGIEMAPPPPRRSRQAGQFGVELPEASTEVDAEYVLAAR